MNILQGHYPMLVLATVAREPGHGYTIVKRLNSFARDAFDLPEGTVYPLLHKLENDGLISGKWQRTDSGRDIKVYTATAKGRRMLAKQSTRWDAITAAVSSILGNRPKGIRV